MKALVSQDANVAGSVSCGSGCIIQQTAEVVGILGRKSKTKSFFFVLKLSSPEVMMGDGNLVECAVIKATKESRPVVIGSGNVFEDKCVIENSQVFDDESFAFALVCT